MKKRTIRIFIVATGLAAGILGGLSLWGKVSFRARMYSTTAGAPPINIKIDIEEYSPSDEVQKLSDAINKGDETGFYRILRGLNKGSIQFIGGLGMNIKINVVQEQSTDDGRSARRASARGGYRSVRPFESVPPAPLASLWTSTPQPVPTLATTKVNAARYRIDM